MEPLFYVMAIMGCGDGQAQCPQARVEPAQYQSMPAMPGGDARGVGA